MLKISQDQLSRLGARQREDFLRRLRAHLAGRVAARGGDAAAAPLGAIIDQGLAEARRFGLHTEADVVRLIELRTAARPDAPAPPPTEAEVRVLTWHGPSPKERLDRYAALRAARDPARAAAGAGAGADPMANAATGGTVDPFADPNARPHASAHSGPHPEPGART